MKQIKELNEHIRIDWNILREEVEEEVEII